MRGHHHLFLLSFVAVSAALVGSGPEASAQIDVQGVGLSIPLGCSGGPASDISHRFTIKNTTTASIPTGTLIPWVASDGVTGKVTLVIALPVGASIDVNAPGGAGHAYTCTASFNPGNADLAVDSVTWDTTTSEARINLRNLNAFRAAGASVARFRVVRCPDNELTHIDVPIAAVEPSKTSFISMQISRLKYPGADLLEGYLNVTNSVPETNKTNNRGQSNPCPAR